MRFSTTTRNRTPSPSRGGDDIQGSKPESVGTHHNPFSTEAAVNERENILKLVYPGSNTFSGLMESTAAVGVVGGGSGSSEAIPSLSQQGFRVPHVDKELNDSRPLTPIGKRRRSSTRHKKSVNKTTAVLALNAAACLDGCDDQLLPASFRALETELKFHPSLLGKITLSQALALSLSCPVWGYLADRFSRKRIMSIGMISWGFTTMMLAFASNLWHIVLLRSLNGLFLGSIGPISQSVLADITPEMSRGFQFGLVQMCSSGGRVIGGVVTTSVALLHFGGFNVRAYILSLLMTFQIVYECLNLRLPMNGGDCDDSEEVLVAVVVVILNFIF